MNQNQSWIRPFDYLVLASILLVSVMIGIYHGFQLKLKRFAQSILKSSNRVQSSPHEIELKEGLKKHELKSEKAGGDETTNEYLSANSSMGVLPITFSLLASFFSATGLVGTPTEIYQYGIQFYVSAWACATTPLIGAFVTGPFFSRLNIESVFEYVELRYETKSVRMVGMVCYVLRNFISASIFTFGPATALSLIINMNQNITIGIIGLLASFYTCVGGMKAVIWTDLFQAMVMLVTVVMIVVKGVHDVGGVASFWEINKQGGRLNLFDFNPDPFVRQSFWSLYFGGIVYFSQMIQRFKAAKSQKKGQIALLLNTPICLFYISLCCLIGLVIYANYRFCDPLMMNQISNSNQYSSYFVMHNLHVIPGAIGLFLGALFCSSLSSLASCLNSLTVIIWRDFLQSFEYFRSFSDRASLTCNKLIVVLCGLIGTLLSYVVSISGNNLIQLNNSLNGTLNAPLVGLFVLSMFFGCANKYGAIAGTLAGLFVNLWLSIGAFILDPAYPKLEISISACSNVSVYSSNSSSVYESTSQSKPEIEGFDKFYSLSYMWYTTLGTVFTITVGVLVSIATGGLRKKTPVHLLVFNLSRCIERG